MSTFLHAARRTVQMEPDLFAAAERQRVRALPLSARRLVQRHGLPAATAVIIAESAGFQMAESGR
ncbi:hypothetical protein [uncultured Reyranella sp.]|uniref:hypothetical protein n=1 Tax=uncultured Reyranella sp. TaxID=735512 RepID=UPI00259C8456|nr:hypothetical protein [uncultured Reyranella sp.]